NTTRHASFASEPVLQLKRDRVSGYAGASPSGTVEFTSIKRVVRPPPVTSITAVACAALQMARWWRIASIVTTSD
ncbi:hypothetical protein, partial [Burkholderia gladioli]|uniref:hypothetical protein n=1 Tax=Burkholderia gladioli TaxID=28095 RepID=UPI001ABAF3D8